MTQPPSHREPTREAGRDLDALVAEKVMGWRLADRIKMGWGDGPDVYLTYPEGASADDYDAPSRMNFHPSSDISAAWTVVEKMTKDGWRFELVHEDFDLPWMAEFSNPRLFAAEATSAPLAICLAALAALSNAPQEAER